MKRRYKVIIILFILEYLCMALMNKLNIYVQTWIGNAIGALLFCIPLLLLLYFLSRDEDVSKKYRILGKIGLIFLIFCYVAGGIGKAIALKSNV